MTKPVKKNVCFCMKKLEGIIYLIRCIAIKRALANVTNDNPYLNFWILTYGVYLDTPVVEWCKIFGSENEDTHWKKSIPTDKHGTFQKELLKSLATNESVWKEYIKEMKTYRNKYVSHTDLDFKEKLENYPILDHALGSAFFYYEQLRLEYLGLWNPPFIRDYYNAFLEHTTDVAKEAYQATENIKELESYKYFLKLPQ